MNGQAAQYTAITIRVEPSDKDLLELAAKVEGRAIAAVVSWAARLYAMSVVADSSRDLQSASKKILDDRLQEDADSLRYRFTQDVDRYGRFLEYIGCRPGND
jgi:uncharacterized protein (DUF1778 family)